MILKKILQANEEGSRFRISAEIEAPQNKQLLSNRSLANYN